MRILFITVLSVYCNFVVAIENQLQQHASPYLAMHGDDPVAWQEWNKEAVKRALNENKLIYVSSGYFSCHWCHVMQRESYKDKQVAEILNKYFIPIKVDREINSALDSRLIEFVEKTQGHAGWPLNVFITPEGYPLVGMTYVPRSNFISILNNIQKKWHEDSKQLKQIAVSASEELNKTQQSESKAIPPDSGVSYMRLFLQQAESMSDDMAGGFGDENKFPSYPQLKTLLKGYEYHPTEKLKHFLLLTLNNMASQGLNDHLSGGFFRYTVDPVWQVPHFEKMLYDNALLASLYTDAAVIFNNKKFEKVAKSTLDFMLKVLRSEQGAYIASLSAVDDKGLEGSYYLWDKKELKKILNNKEFQVMELSWQLVGNESLVGGLHLVEAHDFSYIEKKLKLSSMAVKKYFFAAKEKMLQERSKRKLPKDDKVLSGWNGLALSAFAKAARIFNKPEYGHAAEKIKKYIYVYLWNQNTLMRAVKQDKYLGAGGLEDYAYVAQGLIDLLEYSDNKEDRLWLEELIDQSWQRFYGKQGWLLAEDMLLRYGQGEAVVADGVLPSPAAVLIDVSIKLALRKKNKDLLDKSLVALHADDESVSSQPFWYASYISTLFDYQKNVTR